MDKDTRNRIERATQAARGLLEQDFADQLAGVFDIRLDGTIAAVFADLGHGVMDAAMVEAAAYCLIKQ
jgi:hypothetical protein